jgi:hypothetical protein
VEAILIIQMAIMAGYHSHAKATDNVGNNNAQFLRRFHVEENILRKKHPGKCTEICAWLSVYLYHDEIRPRETKELKIYELMAVSIVTHTCRYETCAVNRRRNRKLKHQE